MAQFRATIKGQRGSASRLGSKSSGIRADVNGWNGGVTVEATVNSLHGVDVFHIYATGGSNGGKNGLYLGYVDDVGGWHPATPQNTDAAPAQICSDCGAVFGDEPCARDCSNA